jgi:hypothetical protein
MTYPHSELIELGIWRYQGVHCWLDLGFVSKTRLITDVLYSARKNDRTRKTQMASPTEYAPNLWALARQDPVSNLVQPLDIDRIPKIT